MTSRYSLIKKVGAGSRSQLFAGEAFIILETTLGWHRSNELRLQSVGVKTGGGSNGCNGSIHFHHESPYHITLSLLSRVVNGLPWSRRAPIQVPILPIL